MVNYVVQLEERKFTIFSCNDTDGRVSIKFTRIFVNEVAIWCKKLLGNDYETWDIDSSGCTFTFQRKVDAMAFKLKWIN